MPSNQKQKKNKWLKWSYSLAWSNFLFLPFLLLSTIFWFSTKLSNDLLYRKEFKVVYQTDKGIVLKSSLPDQLTAKLNGEGWDLIFLKKYSSSSPFIVRIPSNTKYLNKADIINQLNVSLGNQSITVDDIDFIGKAIELEEQISRKIPISFKGELGFETYHKLLGSVEFEPDCVLVTGPVSVLNAMEKYPVAHQNIQDIQKDISKLVQLEKPRYHYLSIEPAEATMNIITEQLTQKALMIPVQIANPGNESCTIVPKEIEVSFLIGLSEFQHISSSDFSAQIILPEDRLMSQQYAVSIVKKPVNAVIQEITPAYVDVFYDH